MTPEVKAALIVSGAIIIATALWIYFSPLKTCVRLATLSVLESSSRY